MNLIPFYRACGGRSFLPSGAVLAGLALLAFISASPGQVTVTTIGGGVRKECGNSYGFAGGNTYSQSQFHLPYATALDSQGDLWVADLDNADVEQITDAGEKSSSLTDEYVSGSNEHPFPNVIGVAIDSSDNLYVLTTTTLSVFDNAPGTFPNLAPKFELPLSMFSSASATAITVVNDASTNIYISFTNSAGGTIIRIPQPYSGSYSAVVNGFAFGPAGLSIQNDGQLAVSDTRNNAIYVVSTNTGSTPVMITGGHGAGLMNGSPAFAAFNQPHGIAASGDGRLVVCDMMNSCVRVIDTSYNTTTLYGTPSNVWSETCCSCSPALYGGWVDGTAGSAAANASSRLPVSVTIAPSGILYVTESYYNLIRSVSGSGLTPASININQVGLTNQPLSTVVTLQASEITATGGTLNASVQPGGSATQVTFEWGLTTNYGSNTASIDISTNLNGTNLVSFALTGLPVNTVIFYQAVAINGGGTSDGGERAFETTTESSTNNQLGITNSPVAGTGATEFLPIVLELEGGSAITSLLFRIEVSPGGSAPPLSALSFVPVTTNDFVPLIGPAPGNTPVDFSITPYPTATFPYSTVSNNGQGLLISASPESGMNIQNFGVVGLLSFQIPYNASAGQTYSINVVNASGSGLPSIPAMNQVLTVSNVPYLAGDSSPASGYNAGDFGDGILDDDDVNNAIFASMGVRVPPLYSDAFNAMDVYPQTPTENGDGLIQFQDWNTILLRAAGLETPNWIRYWTNLGVLFGQTTTNGLASDPFIAGSAAAPKVSVSPPGLVWLRQASIGAGTAANLVPGNTCSLPVYARVRTGYSLSGFQFRAIVTPNGDAPPVGEVQFNPATGVPNPMSLAGLAPNDILEAWELGSFTTPLQNSNYIGAISFQIPSTAQAGQSYAVHFTGVDGAPDSATSYAMESFPGYAWVLGAPLQPASITSDEWKLHFFGSLTSSLAGDNVDADGDGALNWQEYLAGTDPANPLSVFKFNGSGITSNGSNGVALSWLTAPGKTYILQSTPAIGGRSWTAINTNAGDGYTYQFTQNNYNGTAKFFRILLQP
jgi:hypothetical protein